MEYNTIVRAHSHFPQKTVDYEYLIAIFSYKSAPPKHKDLNAVIKQLA